MPLAAALIFAVLLTSSGSGLDAALPDKPDVMRAVDGIPGWTRTGDVETYTKEGLYGYIDGGAEIVLQYGFRELAVFKFKPAAAATAQKEVVLEISKMESAEAAFGLYSTKLEGEEEGWPGIQSDHWISPGQANLVKGEYLVNIMAPECAKQEIGEFAAALEPKIPGRGTVRPEGLDGLPREGMVASSWRYIKGALAAQNESPFLEGEFWGFGGAGEGTSATEAYSAKYGIAPAISKLVIIEFGKTPEGGTLERSILALFNDYLKEVRRDGLTIEGKNDAGRWFLFKRAGASAALVLNEPDRDAARARLEAALAHTATR
jgi:hypothetical protein